MTDTNGWSYYGKKVWDAVNEQQKSWRDMLYRCPECKCRTSSIYEFCCVEHEISYTLRNGYAN